MAQRDDTTRQQQNGQRRGGNRTDHQKGDSQTTGKHVGQSEHDKAERQKQQAEVSSEGADESTDRPSSSGDGI
jgi:hypothetical protein